MEYKTLSWKIGTPLENIKTMVIMETLLHCGGNIEMTCEHLKIGRCTLYRWADMNKVNLPLIRVQYKGKRPRRKVKKSNQMDLPFGK